MKFPVITSDDALFLEPADRGDDIFFRISEINYLFRVELPIPRVFGYEIVNVGGYEFFSEDSDLMDVVWRFRTFINRAGKNIAVIGLLLQVAVVFKFINSQIYLFFVISPSYYFLLVKRLSGIILRVRKYCL